MKKAAEKRIKTLIEKHSIPPLEVIIPILERTGRGEEELTAQVYETYFSLAREMKEVLGLKGRDMKTLAKLEEVLFSLGGEKMEPNELTESRFSFFVCDCPMMRVGKDVSLRVKEKFCDVVCIGASKALMDAVFGSRGCVCSWDKALVRKAKKCSLAYELVKGE